MCQDGVSFSLDTFVARRWIKRAGSIEDCPCEAAVVLQTNLSWTSLRVSSATSADCARFFTLCLFECLTSKLVICTRLASASTSYSSTNVIGHRKSKHDAFSEHTVPATTPKSPVEHHSVPHGCVSN